MSTENTHALEKLTTTDMSDGGLLKPQEFNRFFRNVEQSSTVLDSARAIPVQAPEGDIPRMGIGSRVMQGVGEGEAGAKQSVEQPSVPYHTQKVSIPWEVTWEVANETIDSATDEIRQVFTNQFSNDLEILASVGDETSADPFESINDGWLTLAESRGAPTYNHDDAGDGSGSAQPVNKELFSGMLGTLAPRYREGQNLTFLMSYDQHQTYKEYLTDRSTAAGDAMLLSKEEPTGYGYPILTPLSWPDDTVMLTDMNNLAYVIQDNVRLKQTTEGQYVVDHDMAAVLNLLAKVDYQVVESEAVCIGTDIAAPA